MTARFTYNKCTLVKKNKDRLCSVKVNTMIIKAAMQLREALKKTTPDFWTLSKRLKPPLPPHPLLGRTKFGHSRILNEFLLNVSK